MKPVKKSRNLKKKKKQQRAERLRNWLRYGVAFLMLLLLMHGIFGDHGYLAMRRARADVDRLREEIQKLNEENRRISGEVRALKNDPAAIERLAREEMGLARPGELIFRLPENPADGGAAPPASSQKKLAPE